MMNNPTANLIQELSTDFLLAVDALEKCERDGGKVVFTGIGKAGHVARYASSLMASAAMQSAFLHPVEAAHGDFGNISAADCLVVLSHSGASLEPLAVIEHARWLRKVPVIAITSQADSTIAVNSDMTLVYDAPQEAIGKVPANASLMQMAMCNQLVIETAKRLQRDANYLLERHPGGAIGKAYRG